MKVTQITDLHIGEKREDTYRVDVRHNFLMILGEVKIHAPDLIIITGDLCYKYGVTEIYEWIKEKMDNLDIPYLVIPGNHDDVELMRDVFKIDYTQSEEEIFFARKLDKRTALFLDSSKASMSHEQLNWLKRQLKQGEENILVFTHYPPCPMDCLFMDGKYPYQDSRELMEVFYESKKNIHLFCGHFHSERTLHLKNVNVYLSPSIIVQISPSSKDFKIEHKKIGFRNIELQQERLISYVQYLNGRDLEILG